MSRIDKFIEYEFLAENLDSHDNVVDVVMINERISGNEAIQNAIQKGFEKHPIMGLEGNWQLHGFNQTGCRLNQTITYQKTQERSLEFAEKKYPIITQG